MTDIKKYWILFGYDLDTNSPEKKIVFPIVFKAKTGRQAVRKNRIKINSYLKKNGYNIGHNVIIKTFELHESNSETMCFKIRKCSEGVVITKIDIIKKILKNYNLDNFFGGNV